MPALSKSSRLVGPPIRYTNGRQGVNYFFSGCKSIKLLGYNQIYFHFFTNFTIHLHTSMLFEPFSVSFDILIDFSNSSVPSCILNVSLSPP